eukprot:TRINITY_DN28805_c0_g1_i2.p1 TRINITY_DN28805_c0_g1~~TRINITY_DN28805_c0_g1_i2.p1  ORF type:complete len:125 (-),score=12.11 TRINITY_DN28805_c0_g1_i2:223-597(-)
MVGPVMRSMLRRAALPSADVQRASRAETAAELFDLDDGFFLPPPALEFQSLLGTEPVHISRQQLCRRGAVRVGRQRVANRLRPQARKFTACGAPEACGRPEAIPALAWSSMRPRIARMSHRCRS